MHAIFTGVLDLFFLLNQLYLPEDEEQWNLPHIVAVANIAFTALISCCVGCLAGYHSKLACGGETTNEEIRGKYTAGGVNPYDDGCVSNCRAFWYGGTSRVYAETGEYDAEYLSKIEPNVFVIKEHQANLDRPS